MADPRHGLVFDLAQKFTETFGEGKPNFEDILHGLHELGNDRLWEVALVLVLDIARECPSHLRDGAKSPDVYRILPPRRSDFSWAKSIARTEGYRIFRLRHWVVARSGARLINSGQDFLQHVLNIHNMYNDPDDGADAASKALEAIDPGFLISAFLPAAGLTLGIIRS